MTAFFKKSKDNKDVKPVQETEKVSDTPIEIKGNWLASSQSGSAGSQQVLKEFYVSEKASMLNTMNQYVFKVFNNANKGQIKKQVEKVFDVKVKDIKVTNMPRKRRDIGQHPGYKSGFKKAIVVLEEGYSIDQAKA